MCFDTWSKIFILKNKKVSAKMNKKTDEEKEVLEKQHQKYMKQALRQAKKAYENGDVPIGCIIVYEGKVIARDYNRRNKDKQSLAHAEMKAIKKASKVMGDWRLED